MSGGALAMTLVLDEGEIGTMLICLNQNVEDLTNFKMPPEITDPVAIQETQANVTALLAATKALRDKFLNTATAMTSGTK
jgi:hypothetical protein